MQLHLGSSSSEISSISSTTASVKLNTRNTRLINSHFGKSCSRTSTKYLQKISSLPSSASSHGANRHKIKRPNLTRKQNGHDYRITANSDSKHTSCGSSRKSNAIPLKRKQVSFRLVGKTFVGLFYTFWVFTWCLGQIIYPLTSKELTNHTLSRFLAKKTFFNSWWVSIYYVLNPLPF